MNVGMLLVLLAVNPPAPSLTAPGNVRIAQMDAPPMASPAMPTIEPAAPASAMTYGTPAMDYGTGGCCGGAQGGEFVGGMDVMDGYAGELGAMGGCYGWFDNGMGDCGGCGRAGRLCGLRGGCHHCDPDKHIRCRAAWNLSPGDMYQWRPYFPVCHGNYYFRPYHFSDVAKQQQIAAGWGANPISPYTSDLFENLYLEMGIPGADYYENIPAPEKTKVHPSDHFRPIKRW